MLKSIYGSHTVPSMEQSVSNNSGNVNSNNMLETAKKIAKKMTVTETMKFGGKNIT